MIMTVGHKMRAGILLIVLWSVSFIGVVSAARADENVLATYNLEKGKKAYCSKYDAKLWEANAKDDGRECVWFVRIARSDILPNTTSDHAYSLYDNAKDEWFVGSQPKAGAVIVFRTGYGEHGHVGIVTEVKSNHIIIWESNYRKDAAGHPLITERKVFNPTVYRYIYAKDSGTPPILQKPIPIRPPLATQITTALVIDWSGSMKWQDKIGRAAQACGAYVDGCGRWDHACLATFGNEGKLVVGMKPLNAKANKAAIKSKAKGIGPDEGTNIGAGLEMAYDQLARCKEPGRKVALLLSDGCNNRGSFDSAVQKFASKGWPIYTVAYGRDADRKTLAHIAYSTGGFFSPAETANIIQVYQKIRAQSGLGSVLVSYNDNIEQGSVLSYLVEIAQDIKSAVFSADWQGSRVELRLKTPSGKMITPQNYADYEGVSYTESDTYSIYLVDRPESGNWAAELHGREIPRKEQVNLTVSGKSPLWANVLGMEAEYARNRPVQINTRVAEVLDDEPIRPKQVEVTAWVRKPDPNIKKRIRGGRIDVGGMLGDLLERAIEGDKKIRLYDDGQHGDLAAGDGIYGGVYDDVDCNGAYRVRIDCKIRTSSGKEIARTLRESFQVGPIENNEITLADFLRFIGN